MTDVTVTLKPCPFCGSANVFLQDGSSRYVECRDCYAEGPWNDYDAVVAIAAWNTRHSAPAGEVTQVDRATRTARFLADQKAAAAALASLPDSTRARLEVWQTAQSEWFDGTVLEIVAEFIAFEDALRAKDRANG